MSGLVVENLRKSFGSSVAVDRISFHVNRGEFVSLLGPSGCGKTTTLRCIAGFEDPEEGSVTIDGEKIIDAARNLYVPPNRRNFGMVFQSYALWPHMTVLANVSYPLRIRGGMSSAEIRDRASDTLKAVRLDGYEERFPSELSGGQQQRVALGRALVMEPRMLLFDEPLSNLDAKLRERMRFELVEIQSKLDVPAIYVTHDQTEALVMSRRVIVMDRGRIAQEGSPADVYFEPQSRFVAEFVGLSNFIEGTLQGSEAGTHVTMSTLLGDLRCTGNLLPGSSRLLIAIRPEHLHIGDAAAEAANILSGVLSACYFLGAHFEYIVQVNDVPLRVQSNTRLDKQIGEKVRLWAAPKHCRIVLDEAAA